MALDKKQQHNNNTLSHPKALTKKFLSFNEYESNDIGELRRFIWLVLCFVAQTEKFVTYRQLLFTVTILLSGDKV